MEPNNSTQETIPNQYSQQLTSEQPVKQNGFLLPIIGIILFIVIVGAGAFYLGTNKSSNVQPTSTNDQNQESASADISSQTNGFPVYSGATFIKSEVIPPCKENEYSGFSICNAKTYVWQVNANYDQIFNWYKQDNSGWTCSGGAGEYTDSNNASGVTMCRKNSLSYQLFIHTKNGATTLTLAVPQGSPTDETANWNTYTNVRYGYSIKYPSELSYDEYSNGDTRFYLTTDGKNNKTPTGLKDSLAILVSTGSSPENAAMEELKQTYEEKVSFNNASGIRMKSNNNFPFDYYLSPTGRNTPILRVYESIDYSTLTASKNEKAAEIFKKMITTFKFTKQASINGTANWKTYDNQNQGVTFSIKYPSDKKADVNTTDPNIGFCNLGPSLVSIDLYNPDQEIPNQGLGTEFRGFLGTTITMQLLQYDLTVDKWISDNCKDSWILSPSTSKKSIVVQGTTVTQYTGGEFGTGSFVIIPRGKKVYMIYGWPVDGKEQLDTFNTMVSTFKASE